MCIGPFLNTTIGFFLLSNIRMNIKCRRFGLMPYDFRLWLPPFSISNIVFELFETAFNYYCWKKHLDLARTDIMLNMQIQLYSVVVAHTKIKRINNPFILGYNYNNYECVHYSIDANGGSNFVAGHYGINFIHIQYINTWRARRAQYIDAPRANGVHWNKIHANKYI